MARKVVSLTVAILFFVNSVSFGLSVQPASRRPKVQGDMYAAAEELCRTTPEKEVALGAIDAVRLQGMLPEIKGAQNFRSPAPRDWKNPPRGWTRNAVNRTLLKTGNFVEVLECFRDNKTGIPASSLTIREGSFPRKGKGVYMARVTPNQDGTYLIRVHPAFPPIYNFLRKHDVWFDYTFPDNSELRTISLSLGIPQYIGPHEMRSLFKGTSKLKGQAGHLRDFPGFQPEEREAYKIGGRYSEHGIADAIRLCLEESLLIGDWAEVRNGDYISYFKTRLDWIFYGIGAERWEGDPLKHRQKFPNLLGKANKAKREFAIQLALRINQEFLSGLSEKEKDELYALVEAAKSRSERDRAPEPKAVPGTYAKASSGDSAEGPKAEKPVTGGAQLGEGRSRASAAEISVEYTLPEGVEIRELKKEAVSRVIEVSLFGDRVTFGDDNWNVDEAKKILEKYDIHVLHCYADRLALWRNSWIGRWEAEIRTPLNVKDVTNVFAKLFGRIEITLPNGESVYVTNSNNPFEAETSLRRAFLNTDIKVSQHIGMRINLRRGGMHSSLNAPLEPEAVREAVAKLYADAEPPLTVLGITHPDMNKPVGSKPRYYKDEHPEQEDTSEVENDDSGLLEKETVAGLFGREIAEAGLNDDVIHILLRELGIAMQNFDNAKTPEDKGECLEVIRNFRNPTGISSELHEALSQIYKPEEDPMRWQDAWYAIDELKKAFGAGNVSEPPAANPQTGKPTEANAKAGEPFDANEGSRAEARGQEPAVSAVDIVIDVARGEGPEFTVEVEEWPPTIAEKRQIFAALAVLDDKDTEIEILVPQEFQLSLTKVTKDAIRDINRRQKEKTGRQSDAITITPYSGAAHLAKLLKQEKPNVKRAVLADRGENIFEEISRQEREELYRLLTRVRLLNADLSLLYPHLVLIPEGEAVDDADAIARDANAKTAHELQIVMMTSLACILDNSNGREANLIKPILVDMLDSFIFNFDHTLSEIETKEYVDKIGEEETDVEYFMERMISLVGWTGSLLRRLRYLVQFA